MRLIDNLKEYSRITPTNLLYDRALLWLFVSLLLIGLIAVTSASIPVGTRLFNDSFYFAKRDAIYVVLSIFACYTVLNIPTSFWEKYYGYVFWLAVILLLLVLIPGIGTRINGARRWIPMVFLTSSLPSSPSWHSLAFLLAILLAVMMKCEAVS